MAPHCLHDAGHPVPLRQQKISKKAHTHNEHNTTTLREIGHPIPWRQEKNIHEGTHTQHSRHRTSCMRWVTRMPLPLQKQPTKLKRNAHDTTFLAWQGARRAVPTPKIPPKKAEKKRTDTEKPPKQKTTKVSRWTFWLGTFWGHRLDYNERSSRL